MNILLRPWREADAIACAALANDEAVAANLRDVFPHPYPNRTRAILSRCALRETRIRRCSAWSRWTARSPGAPR